MAAANDSMEAESELQVQRAQSQLEKFTSSPYPMVAARAQREIIDLTHKPAHYLVESTASILDEPGPPDIVLTKNVHPPLPDDDPWQPVRQKRQRRMINALKAYGPIGLAYSLYQEADEEVKANVPDPSLDAFKVMQHDRDSETFHVVSLLYTLPQDVTISLIQGTLAYDVAHDPSIKAFYDLYMKDTGKHPGEYINILSMPGRNLLGGSDKEKGMWLSPADIRRIADIYDGYIDDVPAHRAISDRIDRQFNRKPESRQYVTGQAKAYVKYLRENFVDNIAPQHDGRLHQRAPTEAGWAQNVDERLRQHRNNGSTTACFGFMNALTRLSRLNGGYGFNEPFSALVFPIWTEADGLPQFAEKLLHLITGSYIRYGGYNHYPAGKFIVKLDKDDRAWDLARKNLTDRLDHLQNPDSCELDLQRFRRLNIAATKMHTVKEQLKTVKADIQKANQELENASKAYEDAAAKLKASDARVQEARASGSTWSQDLFKALDSDSRVHEETKSRARALHTSLSNATYRPGPAVVRQPLTEEETARVDANIAGIERKIDVQLAELRRRQAARSARAAEST
ncbi:MAG: hypothetical protein Q9207_003293 [Kuettlingeria erythrocarpa]